MDPFVHTQVADLIGKTPVVRLDRLGPSGRAAILAKLEYLNPGGSVKDRIALSMIDAAEAEGRLRPGMGIVEATSGNTGIGLAMICAERGYRLILTMPETMSFERRSLAIRYGAEVVLTPGKEDIPGAVRRARRLVKRNPGWIEMRQFENPANPQVHRETTGPEILEATGGNAAALVVGVGTGGTITGVGEFLKEHVPGIRIVGVEPAGSAVLSGGSPGLHAIEGIGAGFIPPVLNHEVIDEVIPIDDKDAFRMARRLAREESLLVGVSSGAAVLAARQVAERLSPDQNVVTVLPDTGSRYFSVEEYFKDERDYDESLLL
ncbi:MAG: cysteine synthase A [Candidatus Aminicenantes bacterium]|nr:cysteine synthase A [Candidatus Aminicenantes bacterium]